LEHLWSPWRLDYITGPKDKSTCVFCRHAEETRTSPDNPDSLVLATGLHAYVVLNRYPYNNGHLMVVPYQHTSTLTGLDPAALAELMLLTQRSEQALRDAYRPRGSTSGSISVAPPVPGSRSTCTSTWCRAGTATRTS
jgi:ATP adenylyltransferase